jgi:pimeloyl-ACP methyl ester carboxylesterase
VGYTVAWPPGHQPGDALPLVLALHGYGGNHTNALAGLSIAQAVALQPGGIPLSPMAIVAVDRGNGYWDAHLGDDRMAMLVGELLPRCRALNLGRPPQKLGAIGISMGGYGALLLAERQPGLLAAVAVRLASGRDDPFHPGVVTLARAMRPAAVVAFGKGCHTDSYEASEEPASMAFLARHLV